MNPAIQPEYHRWIMHSRIANNFHISNGEAAKRLAELEVERSEGIKAYKDVSRLDALLAAYRLLLCDRSDNTLEAPCDDCSHWFN